MRLLLVTCLVGLFSITFSFLVENPDPSLDLEWMSFKEVYGKQYRDDKDEKNRKGIFERNLREIKIQNLDHSRGKSSFTMGVNQFSDMTKQEVINKMMGLRVPVNRSRLANTYRSPLHLAKLPDQVDWRTKGVVTEVKDQKNCGSCWAFSATGSIEGQHARLSGNLVSLSEQNLVDCSGSTGNEGCSGGYMDWAFEYVKQDGIDTEESYPYTAQDDTCTFSKEKVGATITGIVDLPKGDEQKLMEVVATIGPVSVAIDASPSSFHHYKSGIYDEPDCTTDLLCHGVLVVGYGVEDGKDYWLVKNSWGATWGDQGYIKMSRNKENQCGIVSLASYPTV